MGSEGVLDEEAMEKRGGCITYLGRKKMKSLEKEMKCGMGGDKSEAILNRWSA